LGFGFLITSRKPKYIVFFCSSAPVTPGSTRRLREAFEALAEPIVACESALVRLSLISEAAAGARETGGLVLRPSPVLEAAVVALGLPEDPFAGDAVIAGAVEEAVARIGAVHLEGLRLEAPHAGNVGAEADLVARA
jgi:hypothetical protein